MQTDSGPMLRLRVTKGGGGSVPAHPRIVETLRYLPVRDAAWWDCGPVNVSRAVAAHLRNCGVNATAHQLRHYAGTTWYEASGHDLLTTARLLRHSDVSTTQTYAAISPARPTEVVGIVHLDMPG